MAKRIVVLLDTDEVDEFLHVCRGNNSSMQETLVGLIRKHIEESRDGYQERSVEQVPEE